MGASNWYDTGNVYEPRSVMSYPSFGFAKDNTIPVATLKNGDYIQDGPRISTTDALQAQKFYCQDLTDGGGNAMFPNFQFKDGTTCTTLDEVGAIRTVFTDRLCDGWQDCPNSEDEDGTIVACKAKHAKTPDGCCGGVMRGDVECVYTTDNLFKGKGTYACTDGTAIAWTDYLGGMWIVLQAEYYPYSGKVYLDCFLPFTILY